MRVEPCPAGVARDIVTRWHYLHRPPPVSHAYALWPDDGLMNEDIVGVVSFGIPASPNLMQSASPGNPAWVLELNRLWIHDAMPRNTASWFVSRALAMLPPSIVVSYADTAAGHEGYVYRALNFRYAGGSDPIRETVWSGAHTRDSSRMPKKNAAFLKKSPHAYEHGYKRIEPKPTGMVERSLKHKYWTVTGNRTERQFLSTVCPWGSYEWPIARE